MLLVISFTVGLVVARLVYLWCQNFIMGWWCSKFYLPQFTMLVFWSPTFLFNNINICTYWLQNNITADVFLSGIATVILSVVIFGVLMWKYCFVLGVSYFESIFICECWISLYVSTFPIVGCLLPVVNTFFWPVPDVFCQSFFAFPHFLFPSFLPVFYYTHFLHRT